MYIIAIRLGTEIWAWVPVDLYQFLKMQHIFKNPREVANIKALNLINVALQGS